MDDTTAADAYGESFAAVYDEWYPSEARAAAVVTAIDGLRPPTTSAGAAPAGRVLELGIGTGVLALALARAGWEVVGIDSSRAMLDALRAKGPAPTVTATIGDAGDPTTWPTGPFDVVLAAWNLITNLADRDEQRALLRGAADALAPHGQLALEAFVPLPPPRRERRVAFGAVGDASTTPGRVPSGAWVRVHTDADPATTTIEGRHVELRDGAVVVRPWRVCWIGVAELDAMAATAGLEVFERTEDWSGSAFVADQSPGHVTRYRLNPA
jgi:SAM-dependent methyltransferase